MNRFDLKEYGLCIRNLQAYESACELAIELHGAAHVPDEIAKTILPLFEQCMALAKGIALQDCYDTIAVAHLNVSNKPGMNASAMQVYIQSAKDALLRAAFYNKFIFVENDRHHMLDRPDLLGEQVAVAFPNAIPDIRETGNCLAAECNTAAVFHLMRVLEWGLRYLCTSMGIKQLKQSTRSGKVKLSPISYAQWEDILNQLQVTIDTKMKSSKKGPTKQRDQEFYYPILQDFSGIRDAWRNHVMHTRAEYGRKDASAVLDHVTRIMARLATRLAPKPKSNRRPIIISAKWGIGENKYRDVADLLRGYIAAGTEELRAANEFFVDHYPSHLKHLIVEYKMPRGKTTKTMTFEEGALVRFTA
jgi:hypothetical protein